MAALLASVVRISSRFLFRSTKVNRHVKFRKCHYLTYSCIAARVNLHHIPRRSLKCSESCRFMSGSTSHDDRKCWKCGSATNSEVELFFCNCGVVQSVPTDMTFFKAMKCEEKFDIDVQSLSELYKDLQRKLHPDKYTQKSKEEQLLAEHQSSFINKAYTTLLKPLSRGLYLLEIHNDPIEETNSAVDPEFLMEIMEVNEDITEANGDIDALLKVENINSAKMEQCIKNISEAFSNGNVPSAKQQLIKLKYFCNVDEKIKEIYRQKMDVH